MMGQRMMHDDVSTVRGNRIEEGVSIAKIMLTQATVWGFTLDIIRAIVVAIRFTKACGARSRSVIVGSGYVLSFFPTPAIGNAKTCGRYAVCRHLDTMNGDAIDPHAEGTHTRCVRVCD